MSAKEAEKIRQELTTGYITNITHQLGDFFMIQLTPEWIALEAQCTTPNLVAQYDRYTIMLLNGYMGFGLAIDYMTTAIRATTNG